VTAVAGRFVDAYDLVILDLDGVVYLIDRPVPGAVEAIAELHRSGPPVAYATNNASRRADEVAALLTTMGVAASAAEVLTSARAAAVVLRDRFPAGSPVLVVGAEALRAEVRDAGLVPVARADNAPAAVIQGYGPTVGWTDLAEACIAVRKGALWVATNTDRTLPSPRGPLPGNGALVAALRTALGRDPDLVVGKPEPGLFLAAARRASARHPLVVGDRLDTDIEGAVRAGMDSLLVLTGVCTARDVLAAPASRRPTHVAADLSALFTVDGAVRVPLPDRAHGGWRVSRRGSGGLELSGAGEALDALRALCGPAWAETAEPAAPAVTAGSDPAAEALRVLGLAG
jgi:HAD superfamily hydrolase (TIGR01450 family)